MQRLAGLVAAAGLVFAVGCAQTDTGITTAVKAKMAADDTVKAYQIDVDTQKHVVTLSGNVETAAAKEQAVTIARNTDGVTDVVDHLVVTGASAPTAGVVDSTVNSVEHGASALKEDAERAGSAIKQESREAAESLKHEGSQAINKTDDAAHRAASSVEDAAITSLVKTKFLADSTVKGLQIDVDTSQNVVTLSGTVASQDEANRAVALAREAKGVSRVVNHLRVR